jgi:hypothetical protein
MVFQNETLVWKLCGEYLWRDKTQNRLSWQKGNVCILVFQYDTHYGRWTGSVITAPLISVQQVVFLQFPVYRYSTDA